MSRKKRLPTGMVQRGRVYWADFVVNGQRIRKSLSTQLDAATKILHQLRAKCDEGEFGILARDYPVKDLRVAYQKHCEQSMKPSSRARVELCLDTIFERCPISSVSQIRIDAILSYRQERLNEGKSPRTINQEVGALATMLRWGRKSKLFAMFPLEDLKPLPHDNPKEGRALTDDEVKRLLDASPQPWRDIWFCLLTTGMRKDELANLRFSDIDWDAREIVVHGSMSKNHRTRRIPIDASLWAILQKQKAGRLERKPGKGKTEEITVQVRENFTREHVFVTTQNTPLTHRHCLYGAFMRCCALAKIETRTEFPGGRVEHVDVHSLRRTFATSLIQGGADPKSVQELLGHSTLDMTMRLYAKCHASSKRAAIGKLSYGSGALAPADILPYAGKEANRAV